MWQVMLLLMLLVSATTAVTSNVATASIFVPVVGGLATSMRVHPFTFMVPVGLTCSLAFVLPVSTPPNAMAFASGRLQMRDMIGVRHSPSSPPFPAGVGPRRARPFAPQASAS